MLRGYFKVKIREMNGKMVQNCSRIKTLDGTAPQMKKSGITFI